MTPRKIRSARLRAKPAAGKPDGFRLFDLRVSDETHFTTFDVVLRHLADGGWQSELVIGGPPDKGKGCEGSSQREALVALADWTRRAADGLALLVAEDAKVTTEIVEVEGRAAPPEGE